MRTEARREVDETIDPLSAKADEALNQLDVKAAEFDAACESKAEIARLRAINGTTEAECHLATRLN
jgi:hypothetical protein